MGLAPLEPPVGLAAWVPIVVVNLVLILALAVLLSGCLPPQASFSPGLGTSRVSGLMDVSEDEPLFGGSLIVVFKYHHQFINNADGSAVLRPTAHVVRPERGGAFSIDMPSDVVTMEVLFIAPEHLTERFRFRRQLGVGDIEYRAILRHMPDWRSHYYTYLSPQLQHLIVEPRYRLGPAEQQVLGEWLQRQNERLGARPPAGSEPAGDAKPPQSPRPSPRPSPSPSLSP